MIGRIKSGGGNDSKRDWTGYFNYEPYPGTVNILLDEPSPEIEAGPGYDVFVCRPAKLNGIDGHICGRRSLTRQVILFFVSPVNVRKTLDIKDGDRVNIELKELE